MARPIRSLGGWAGSLVLGLVAFVAPTRAEGPGAARWVGADAALYAEIRRPEILIDRLMEARFQSLLKAVPGYEKALRGDDFRKFRAAVDLVAGSLGTTWDEGLRDLTGGGLAIAFEGDSEQTARSLLLATPRDPEFLARAHAKLLELARKDAADKGKPDPIQESAYRGITVSRHPPNLAHAIVEGTLIVAGGEDALKVVIDRALDRGPTIADDADWKAQHARVGPDALAWSFIRPDRARKLDPKRFGGPEKADPGRTLLFGDWIESARKAPWATQTLTWAEDRIGVELTFPRTPGGPSEAFRRFVPPAGQGAPALLKPPGTIASIGLWRDLSSLWEVRADLFPPEVVQGFAQLDTFAGQFFGGRDFGTGVLGALSSNWRLVIAQQDYTTMDPVPDVKLPAFALIVGLKPDDPEFAQRLKVAFQSFIGLANLGAAQSKAPPLELGSETVEGVTLSTSKFMPTRPTDEPVNQRHNFSPSAAQVGDQFILSSSAGLARDLIRAVKAPGRSADLTWIAEADGPELAKLVDANRPRLVMKTMLEKGVPKARAEREISFLTDLLRYLGHATLTSRDTPEALRIELDFALGSK